MVSDAQLLIVTFCGPTKSLISAVNESAAATTTCSVASGTVTATGLPTDQVVNFFVTDSSGTTGWVLGFTADGTWTVSVPPVNGATTYQFTSRTFGANGSKYTVFASCQA